MIQEIYIIDDDESSLPVFEELFIEEKDFKAAEKLNREAEKHLGPKLVEKIKKGEKKYQDKSEYYFNEAMDKVFAGKIRVEASQIKE